MDDYESELRKEQYILSCLTHRAQSPEVECKKDEGDEKQELSPLQLKQKKLEELNNVINNQYHGVSKHSRSQQGVASQSQASTDNKIHLKTAEGHFTKAGTPLIDELQEKVRHIFNPNICVSFLLLRGI